MQDDILPTPIGLLRCLQALADEAASLSLTATVAALRQAIEACRSESSIGRAPAPLPVEAAPVH